MRERNVLEQSVRQKLGHIWEVRKNEKDNGLKTMLGIQDVCKQRNNRRGKEIPGDNPEKEK